MVEEGNTLFRRWAKYEELHVSGVDLGYGGTITQKIIEGKGTILPGAPVGSGPKKVFIDDVALRVGRFVAQQSKFDKLVLKMYYLQGTGYTVEERAQMLGISNRELYRKLHRLQLDLVCSMPNNSKESVRVQG